MAAIERLTSTLRKELNPVYPYDHLCLVGPDDWRIINGVIIRRAMQEAEHAKLMTLRLSSGIAGFYNCPAGDGRKIPKGYNEVIVGIGDSGIKALLDLGALSCVTCHSGDFFKEMGINVQTDFNWLVQHYDASLLDWDKILKFGLVPNRFYTRPGLSDERVSNIADIFRKKGFDYPPIGYYDNDLPGGDKFHPYDIPTKMEQ